MFQRCQGYYRDARVAKKSMEEIKGELIRMTNVSIMRMSFHIIHNIHGGGISLNQRLWWKNVVAQGSVRFGEKSR